MSVLSDTIPSCAPHELTSKSQPLHEGSCLVSPTWLAAHLSRVHLVDASWYMPHLNRKPEEEYKAQHIPGAVWWDIDAIADVSSPLPHMLPSDADMATAMARLGISHAKPVVVYDTAGVMSAARVWYTLKAFGHPAVAVLNGGLPRWIAEHHPTTAEVTHAEPVAREEWRLQKEWIVDTDTIRRIISSPATKPRVVDARSAERFAGTAPEPRPGLSSGHMANSANVPFTEVVTDGRLRAAADVVATFQRAGVDPAALTADEPLIASCGSGITACILLLALHHSGVPLSSLRLYDASWTGFASTPGAPILQGPASHKPLA